MLPGRVQALVMPMTLAEAVSVTKIAFAGTVDSLHYRRAGGIVTDVHFKDVRFARGFTAPLPLVLTVIGGVMDGHGQGVAEMPVFEVGVRYVILAGDLRTPENLYLPVVGLTNGFFYVERDSTTHRSVVRDSGHRPAGKDMSEGEFLRTIEALGRHRPK